MSKQNNPEPSEWSGDLQGNCPPTLIQMENDARYILSTNNQKYGLACFTKIYSMKNGQLNNYIGIIYLLYM